MKVSEYRTPKKLTMERFRELVYFCLQYDDWRKEYDRLDPLRSAEISDMPKGTSRGDQLELLAIKRAELREKIELVETTAKEVGGSLAPYLLTAVTHNYPYDTMRLKYRIPCGASYFYKIRRDFFDLMDIKKI